jgi:hypothetical protein
LHGHFAPGTDELVMRKMAPTFSSSTLFVCDVKKAKEKKRTTSVKMANGGVWYWEQLLPPSG